MISSIFDRGHDVIRGWRVGKAVQGVGRGAAVPPGASGSPPSAVIEGWVGMGSVLLAQQIIGGSGWGLTNS